MRSCFARNGNIRWIINFPISREIRFEASKLRVAWLWCAPGGGFPPHRQLCENSRLFRYWFPYRSSCLSSDSMYLKCNEIAPACPFRFSVQIHRNRLGISNAISYPDLCSFKAIIVPVGIGHGPGASISSEERACQLICIINSHRVAGVTVSHCMDRQNSPKGTERERERYRNWGVNPANYQTTSQRLLAGGRDTYHIWTHLNAQRNFTWIFHCYPIRNSKLRI